MKRFFSIMLLQGFILLSSVSSITVGQFRNRENALIDEWNSLVGLQRTLKGEAYINFKNYMFGFSDAMGQCYEIAYSYVGAEVLYEQYLEWSEGTQRLKNYCDSDGRFRRYYYDAGFDRVDKMTRRFSSSDF